MTDSLHIRRRAGRIALALGLAVALVLAPAAQHGSAATPAPAGNGLTRAGFENAARPYRFAFPRDHAAHFGYQSEWWYYTGHVRAADGRRFGYELTFFRIGLRPGHPRPLSGQSAWRGNQLFPAHFALTDESGGRFVHVERFAREALGAGYASDRTLDVRADDWSLHGTDPFRMRARSAEAAITFEQHAQKPPAVHGHAGVSIKAACATCASHYYSMTRLHTTGTLVYGGQTLHVDGLSWMDHEFGSDELQANQAGWDWFAIQLDDRRELMLYALRQKDGTITPQSSGSLVERDGRVTHLQLTDFSTTATGTWKSPHTAGVYPSGWHVRVARAGVDVLLQPTLVDQELADTAGGVSYWEGAVDALDPTTRRPLGVGYVELTGYAGAISL